MGNLDCNQLNILWTISPAVDVMFKVDTRWYSWTWRSLSLCSYFYFYRYIYVCWKCSKANINIVTLLSIYSLLLSVHEGHYIIYTVPTCMHLYHVFHGHIDVRLYINELSLVNHCHVCLKLQAWGFVSIQVCLKNAYMLSH